MPEVFLPLKQCIEILGANLQPRGAQAILDQCLQGIMQKVLMHCLVHTCYQNRRSCTVKIKTKLAIMPAIFATLRLCVACKLVARSKIYCVMLSHVFFSIPDRFEDNLHVPHDQAKPFPQKAGAGTLGVTVVTGCRETGRCVGKLWRHLSP